MKSSSAMDVPDMTVAAVRGTSLPQQQGDFSARIPVYAPAGMRILAMAFDLVVILLVITLIMFLPDTQVWDITNNDRSGLWMDVALLVASLPFMYFVGGWVVFGASPGKMLLSLQVVDANTQDELSVSQCLLRYMGYLLNIVSFGMGAVGMFSVTHPQGWHDRLARTVVIRR